MEIKIICWGKGGGLVYWAYNYEEERKITEYCQKQGFDVEYEVKL